MEEVFRCKYLSHENEEIIGFCLNQNCQNATQFCFECLNKNHTQHFNDCIRFTKMIQLINEFIQVNNQSKKQVQELSKQVQNHFEQIQKKIDQDIKILENMNQQLQNKDYLTYKSQIDIIKHYYSKEKQNYINQQILLFNNILETIKIGEAEQNQVVDQINSVQQQDLIKENLMRLRMILNHRNSATLKKYTITEIGLALSNLQKYQEAIECFNIAISINSKNDKVWNDKGLVLKQLNKDQEAIECLTQLFQLIPNMIAHGITKVQHYTIHSNTKRLLSVSTKLSLLVPKMIACGITKANHQKIYKNTKKLLSVSTKLFQLIQNMIQLLETKGRHYITQSNITMQFYVLNKPFPFVQILAVQKQKVHSNYMQTQLIHYLNQDTKMKLKYFIQLHQKQDQ